jgi:prepilin-type N-terminal cleavage/methylation domain-containing protein
MQLIQNKKQKGFTLIEMLVSIALFSVVLTVTLGAIMTIADSNKKARSLMSVTNNLNFAVDSMVRSFKTGQVTLPFVDGDCFNTSEIDYTEEGFTPRPVEYCFDQDGDRGKITKNNIDLTSTDVDIDKVEFIDSSYGNQPMLTIIMSGTVKVSEKISSSFSLQTAVSQRRLEI